MQCPDPTVDGSTSEVQSRPVAEAIAVFVLPASTRPIDPASCHGGTCIHAVYNSSSYDSSQPYGRESRDPFWDQFHFIDD